MLFDAQLQIAAIEAVPGDDHLELVMMLAIALPTPNGVLPLPAGRVRVPMSKEVATELFNEGLKVAAELPDPQPDSPIIVAQSLQGVEQAVEMDKKLKSGK